MNDLFNERMSALKVEYQALVEKKNGSSAKSVGKLVAHWAHPLHHAVD